MIALFLCQKQVYCTINVWTMSVEELAANLTITETVTFTDWVNHSDIAWWTIKLGMELRMQAEFKAIHDVKMLCDMPTSVYTL